MLIKCGECGTEISDKAAACPQCGAPLGVQKPVPVSIVQPPKERNNALLWLLSVPLGLGPAFVIYGFSIPEYEKQANQVRKVCEQMVVDRQTDQYVCDSTFAKMMGKGRNAAHSYVPPPIPGVTSADIDAALADGAQQAAKKKSTKPTEWPKPPDNFQVSK